MRRVRNWPAWARPLIGLFFVLLAIAVRYPLEPYLQFRLPFIMMFAAVLGAATVGGAAPGIVATVVGGILSVVLYARGHTLDFSDVTQLVGLIIFTVTGVSLSLISQKEKDAILVAERSIAEAKENLRRLEVEVERRQSLEAELKRIVAELSRSNRELQDFAFVASHDLQEPLRKIQAFGDRLRVRAGPSLQPDSLDYLARMQNAANRMQALIEDLLQFSRVTSKAQPFESVDLRKVIQGVVDDLQNRIERSGGTVELGKLHPVEADPMQMRQLFQNLIGNALKFQRPGVHPVVKVSSDLQNDTVKIQVTDNGVGFEARHADRIFTIFQRLHGRGEYEGSGIGLAICRKIVERHGGEIHADSKVGEGTTFTVVLPAKQQ